MDGFINIENLFEHLSIAGLEELLHHRDSVLPVRLGCFDAFDPTPQKPFHGISLGCKKRSADDNRAAGILDRKLTEIDQLVKPQFLSFHSRIPSDNGTIDGADFECPEPFRKAAGLNHRNVAIRY